MGILGIRVSGEIGTKLVLSKADLSSIIARFQVAVPFITGIPTNVHSTKSASPFGKVDVVNVYESKVISAPLLIIIYGLVNFTM